MKLKPVLIHKSYLTSLSTALPACFHAMPDGSIYIVYTRFYEKNFTNTGLEFVFAELDRFTIDFESGQLFAPDTTPISLDDFKFMVNNNATNLKILKVHRKYETYEEAQIEINKMASKMAKNKSL